MIRFGIPEPLQACAARARFKGLLTPRNAFSQRTSRSQGAAQVLGFICFARACARTFSSATSNCLLRRCGLLAIQCVAAAVAVVLVMRDQLIAREARSKNLRAAETIVVRHFSAVGGCVDNRRAQASEAVHNGTNTARHVHEAVSSTSTCVVGILSWATICAIRAHCNIVTRKRLLSVDILVELSV